MGRKGKIHENVDTDMKSLKKPKEKRRNSEKRKEKSRDAARCRRSKESEIFADLANALPIPNSVTAQMDKASVMRLAIAYLKIRQILGTETVKTEREENGLDSLLMKSLDGFLLVLSGNGDIVFASDSVIHHLGLSQMDVLGQPLFDYAHPCDHEELRETLTVPKGEEPGNLSRSFFLRLKCTLTNKGRTVNLKSASYKVIHFTGRVISPKRSLDDDSEDHSVILIGEPIPHPSSDTVLEDRTFITRHTMDLKFTYVDDRIGEYFGYNSSDLEGKSLLEFHHTLDSENIGKTFKTLMTKGQAETSCYRFLAKGGGYAWVETQATVTYGSKDGKPQSVVCMHYVLSGIEQPEEILSLSQLCSEPIQSRCEKENITPRGKRSLDSGKPRPVPGAFKVEKRPQRTALEPVTRPRANTENIFAPKAEGMDAGFLGYDEINDCFTMLKDEPDDLTYLAPGAGDTCVPLAVPNMFPLEGFVDLNDMSNIEKDLDCLPLAAFEFPGFDMLESDDGYMSSSMDAHTKSSLSVFAARNVTAEPGRALRYSPISDDGKLELETPICPLAAAVKNKGDLLDLVGEDRGMKRKSPVQPIGFNPVYSMLLEDQQASGPIIKDIPLFSDKDSQSAMSRKLEENGRSKSGVFSDMMYGLTGMSGIRDKATINPVRYGINISPMTCVSDDEEDMEGRAPVISMCDETPFMANLWDLPDLDEPDLFNGGFKKTVSAQDLSGFRPTVEADAFSCGIGNKLAPSSLISEPGGFRSEKLVPPRQSAWRSECNNEPIPPPKRLRVDAETPPKAQHLNSTLGRLLLTSAVRPTTQSLVIQPPREPIGYEYHSQPRLTGGGRQDAAASIPTANQRRDSVLLNLLVSGVDRREGYVCGPSLRDKDVEKRGVYDRYHTSQGQTAISHAPGRTIDKVPRRVHKPYHTYAPES